MVPGSVEDIGRRMEINQHKAPARVQDAGDTPGPDSEVGQPADDTVGGEGDVEAPAFARRLLQPVVYVGALEGSPYAGFLREIAGRVDGFVAYIHSCNR